MTTVKIIVAALFFAVLVWIFQREGTAPYASNIRKEEGGSVKDSRSISSANLEGGTTALHEVALDKSTKDRRRLKKGGKKQQQTEGGNKQKQTASEKEMEGIYLPSTPYPERMKTTLLRDQNKKQKLEFVHIPKTGGTAIEAAGAVKDVQWGVCHHWDKAHCANLNQDNHVFLKKCHVCWHMVPKKNAGYFKGKALFATLRNPYARILSEYYCPFRGYHGKDKNPTTLNQFLQNRLKKARTGRIDDTVHMTPQSEFIFDFRQQKQLVEHPIFYENIGHEINALFENYNSEVRLPTAKTNQGAYTASSKMSVESLNPETIRMLNELYRYDFEYLGYRMINPEMGLGSPSSLPGWGEKYDFNSIYMNDAGKDAISGERLLLEYMG